MATEKGPTKAEVESWLLIIFEKKKLKNISIVLEESANKGEGFMSDVIFRRFFATTEDGLMKEYDVALKCSKKSEFLKEKSPVREAYVNEMYFYNTIFPFFTQFQTNKGINDPFNTVPKCYGIYKSDNKEVLVLQNLRKSGYTLWNKRTPMTRKHIDLVIKEYGKFHAISAAMGDQDPEKLNEFGANLSDFWKSLVDNENMDVIFATAVQETCDILKDDLDEDVLTKFLNLKHQVNYVFKDMIQNFSGLKVIVHGDCWNNNFIFQNEENGNPSKVVLLDWQMSKLSSPVADLCYFLFTNISSDDIEHMDTILKQYYQCFSNHLQCLGSNPDLLYSYDQFINEWKKFSKLGVLLATLLTRMCSLNDEDIPEIPQNAEITEDYSSSFIVVIKNKDYIKNRMRYIVKYAANNSLIE